MKGTTLNTINKMLESLPENKQEQVLNHLYNYITELQDEIKWDLLFKKSEKEISRIAREVKEEIKKGNIEDFDYDRL
ncbi:hypothetical protein JCM12298_26470 [Desulfothermus naphthae]